ncbi:MAG: comEA [Ilumatobacteraceae bacterium]|nr:comEA [Ilumatobacteraceae bacterium]
MESLPERPQPSRPMAEVVRAWLHWFGVARLIVTAAAVLSVGAGAYWLLRSPTTPIENTLPVASRTAASTTSIAPANGSVPTSPPSGVTPEGGTGTTAPASILVYVAGAVASPGVVELPATARVEDAIAAAGGLAGNADLDSVNLAAVVRDGDRIWVPRSGEPVPTVVLPSGGAAAPVGSGVAASPAAPIDLNRATAEDLDALPGVGPATAAAIVAYREANGPFGSVDGLLDVRGIGPAKLDAIRALITV